MRAAALVGAMPLWQKHFHDCADGRGGHGLPLVDVTNVARTPGTRWQTRVDNRVHGRSVCARDGPPQMYIRRGCLTWGHRAPFRMPCRSCPAVDTDPE